MPAVVLRTEEIDVGELSEYPGNARRGNVEVVRDSLRVNGQYKPIVVQQSTGYVLAGNHTLRAARAEEWPTILTTFVECDDDTARRINLVDNRSNDLASYDDQALADMLGELGGEYEGTGFDQDSMDALLASLGPGGYGGRDKDAVPPVPVVPITRPGDIITLGEHRVMCGSALDPEARAMLLRQQPADLVLTDPPYTVSYEEDLSPIQAKYRRQDGKKVTGDALDGAEADAFVSEAMVAVRAVLKAGGVFYVFAPPGVDELRFRLALRDAPLVIRQVILWVKDEFVFGRQDYHWRHESMLYGWREGAGHFFVGDFTQHTLWDCERPKASKEHPTMKPVELMERAVTNSSRPGEHVVDLFGGSGSTLIACTTQGRRCSMMELDPGYCDVIVDRWEKFTGERAQRT